MTDYYDECLIEQTDADETEMFMNMVIGGDYDLLVIDGLLHEAFSHERK